MSKNIKNRAKVLRFPRIILISMIARHSLVWFGKGWQGANWSPSLNQSEITNLRYTYLWLYIYWGISIEIYCIYKVWTHLLIQLNEKVCPNFCLVLYIYTKDTYTHKQTQTNTQTFIAVIVLKELWILLQHHIRGFLHAWYDKRVKIVHSSFHNNSIVFTLFLLLNNTCSWKSFL